MNKIQALEKTIYNLENDLLPYNWQTYETCNCGVVAKTILNGKSLLSAGYHSSPLINETLSPFASNAYCITSNLPLPEVFQSLKDTGFSAQELLELENLSNPEIIKILGWGMHKLGAYSVPFYEHSRSVKEDLLTYLKTWVGMLKEKEPVTRIVYRTVHVSESLIKQAETIITQS